MAKQHRPNQPKNHGGSDASQSQSTSANPAIDASKSMQMSQLPGAGNSYALGLVQAKANGEALESDAPALEAQNGVQGSGTSLPYADQIQASFGHHDVTNVRAHTGSEAKASTDALSAKAYATGSDIAFGSAPDLHTAAHEAAHVVQQRAGVHLKDDMGRPGDQYEQHADQVADAVVAGQSAAPLLDAMPGAGGASTSAIQFEQDHRPGIGGGRGRITNSEGDAAATPAGPSHRPDNNRGQGGEQEEFRGEDAPSNGLAEMQAWADEMSYKCEIFSIRIDNLEERATNLDESTSLKQTAIGAVRGAVGAVQVYNPGDWASLSAASTAYFEALSAVDEYARFVVQAEGANERTLELLEMGARAVHSVSFKAVNLFAASRGLPVRLPPIPDHLFQAAAYAVPDLKDPPGH